MKKVIWRFPLSRADLAAGVVEIDIPKGARLLTVMNKPREGVAIWAEVDDQAVIVKRQIRVVLTGEPFEDVRTIVPETVFQHLNYIGSVMLEQAGPSTLYMNPILVLHIYDEGEARDR